MKHFQSLIFKLKVNLNTYHDIAKDFRFYEDPADEFKFPGENWKANNSQASKSVRLMIGK